MPGADDRPPVVLREERRRTDLNVAVREFGHTRSVGRVLDVSRAGCRVETLSQLRAGQGIWVTLPGIAAQAARVVWARGYIAGCQFAVPLHAAVLEKLLS